MTCSRPHRVATCPMTRIRCPFQRRGGAIPGRRNSHTDDGHGFLPPVDMTWARHALPQGVRRASTGGESEPLAPLCRR
jgi:hypothetical protein